MDKAQAIHSFWNSFGVPAYDENSAYDSQMEIEFPYITYSVSTDSLGFPVVMTADVWYKSYSWKEISEKTEQIAKYIETEMRPIPLDVGYLYITKGTPFAQRMTEETGVDNVRRMFLIINAEFLTIY